MRGVGVSHPVVQWFMLHTERVLWVASVRSDRLRVETPREVEVCFVLRGSLEFPNEFRVGDVDFITDAIEVVDATVRIRDRPARYAIYV